MQHTRPRNLLANIAIMMASLSLLACAGPTAYKQATGDSEFGYSQQKLQADRYRVKFAGNSKTTRETVENYLLYRAAELTLEQGGDYFIVQSEDVQRNVERRTAVTGAGFGFSPFFFGAGLGGTAATSSKEDFTAYGTITIREGTPASENTRAYDARELKANLESRINRSPD